MDDNDKDKENTQSADPAPKQKRTMFSKNIVINFDNGGEIHLRRPTTKELNAHDKQAHPSGRKGLQVDKLDPVGARVAMFDKIFIKIVACDDEDGAIPEDGLDRIPDDEKAYIILHHVQVKEDIQTKN